MSKNRKAGAVPAPAPRPAEDPAIEISGSVPLDQLRPSPTNPRKSFPAASIEELAASFRTHGILQPLLVRPIGAAARYDGGDWHGLDYFEVVAGERRFRAARLNEVASVPVVVRFLTDDQVLEIQLIENDQREDVLPSEQAAAYGRFVAAGKTLGQIHAATGKSTGFIRSVLALGKVPAAALEAVDIGKLPRRTAEVIARIPNPTARAEAVKWVLAGDPNYHRSGKPRQRDDAPLTLVETSRMIERGFQVELKAAPFDRKALDLVDGVGSCTECPNRAANNAEAIEAGTRGDMCLDPVCYQAKVEAHGKRILAAAKEEGRKVLTKAEAKEVYPYSEHNPRSDFVDLDAKNYSDPKSRTYRQILKDKLKPEQVAVCVSPHSGAVIELVKSDTIRRLLATAAPKSAPDAARKAAEKRDRDKAELRNATARLAGKKVAETIIAGGAVLPPDKLLRPLVLVLIDSIWADAARLVAQRRGLGKGPPRDLLAAEAKKLGGADLFAVAAELLAAKLSIGFSAVKAADFWPAFRVDLKACEHTAKAESGKKAPPLFKPDYDAIERDANLANGNGKGAKRRGVVSSVNGSKAPAKSQPQDVAGAEGEAGNTAHSSAGKPAVLRDSAPLCTPGECRVCGCTEENCRKCILRTGTPCTWTSPAKDLCSACLPLLETDISIFFVHGRGIDNGLVSKLTAAGIRTVGHVQAMDKSKPPGKLKADDVEDLQERASKWMAEELDQLGPAVTKPAGDLRLAQVDGMPASIWQAFEKRSIRTLADLGSLIDKNWSTVAAQTPREDLLYRVIVAEVGHEGFLATMSRDALMRHLQPGWKPAATDSKSEPTAAGDLVLAALPRSVREILGRKRIETVEKLMVEVDEARELDDVEPRTALVTYFESLMGVSKKDARTAANTIADHLQQLEGAL